MEPSEKEFQMIETFIEIMTWKCVQIIVKSSQGEDLSNSTSGVPIAWFGLTFKNDQDLIGECNKTLQNSCLKRSQKLNIEISLTTLDKDTIPLEIWTIGVKEPCHMPVGDVYSEIDLVLKGVLEKAITSLSYQLSMRIASKTYPINYRMFTEDPNYATLGEDNKEFKVGHVDTPLGVIYIALQSRTHLRVGNTSKNDERRDFCVKTSPKTDSSRASQRSNVKKDITRDKKNPLQPELSSQNYLNADAMFQRLLNLSHYKSTELDGLYL